MHGLVFVQVDADTSNSRGVHGCQLVKCHCAGIDHTDGFGIVCAQLGDESLEGGTIGPIGKAMG